jgi:hypothetical protein
MTRTIFLSVGGGRRLGFLLLNKYFACCFYASTPPFFLCALCPFKNNITHRHQGKISPPRKENGWSLNHSKKTNYKLYDMKV